MIFAVVDWSKRRSWNPEDFGSNFSWGENYKSKLGFVYFKWTLENQTH